MAGGNNRRPGSKGAKGGKSAKRGAPNPSGGKPSKPQKNKGNKKRRHAGSDDDSDFGDVHIPTPKSKVPVVNPDDDDDKKQLKRKKELIKGPIFKTDAPDDYQKLLGTLSKERIQQLLAHKITHEGSGNNDNNNDKKKNAAKQQHESEDDDDDDEEDDNEEDDQYFDDEQLAEYKKKYGEDFEIVAEGEEGDEAELEEDDDDNETDEEGAAEQKKAEKRVEKRKKEATTVEAFDGSDALTEADNALLGSTDNGWGRHFFAARSSSDIAAIKNYKFTAFEDPDLGPKVYTNKLPAPQKKETLDDYKIHPKIQNRLKKKRAEAKKEDMFTPLQNSLFAIMDEYRDLDYPIEDWRTAKQIMEVYTLHVVNHVCRTKAKIYHDNAELHEAKKQNKDIGERRDQTFNRPTVLVLLPFRNTALQFVKVLSKLYPAESEPIKMESFKEHFTDFRPISKNKKGHYYEQFEGNIDDCFQLGISLRRDRIHLFEDLYDCDIVLASPLGLRRVVGVAGEKRDFDFLSSIQVCILDQCNVFVMQNWDHVNTIMDVLNKIPKKQTSADFTRIHEWQLNGWTKNMRQTLFFSFYRHAEINSVINKCVNVNGLVRVRGIYEGQVSFLKTRRKQVFQRLDCTELEEINEFRFKFFCNEIFPKLKHSTGRGFLIFCSSYFEFVRLRNFLAEERADFDAICEYDNAYDTQTIHRKFYKDQKKYLLYTERHWFFIRPVKFRSVENIIWYSLPENELAYRYIMQWISTGAAGDNKNKSNKQEPTVYAIYSIFDMMQLERIVGTQRAQLMIKSDQDVHMLY